MRISKENLYKLSPEEVKNDYLVKGFFPNQTEQIEIYECKNKNFSDLGVNYPRNCWHQVRLPFSKDADMRKKFVRFYSSNLRVGRILEVLDYIGVTTCYKYLYQNKSDEKVATVVTACVDNMHFYNPINVNHDLIINSYPSYVGASSMEIQIDIWQEDSASTDNQNLYSDSGQQLKASAVFLFVARDKSDHTKKYQLPKFSFEGEEDLDKCNMRYQIGKKHQAKRKQESDDAITKRAPTQQENEYVHKFFTNTEMKENKINIRQTKMEKDLLMHLQDRNLHGKIFGGFVMREAFEIG